ncbi:MAG: potassium channel protein [Calditrichaeota bacterium]|nr:MAG: potassium channel protein [Calditrichota bacterium]
MQKLRIEETLNRTVLFLRRNFLFTIILFIFLICIVGAYIFYRLEIQKNPYFHSFGEALWWVVVSITSVGYGDIVPITPTGRVLGIFIILMGVVIFSLFTAVISSVFVSQKLKEERGLKQISEKNHIILCGWNHTAEQILKVIFSSHSVPSVVLINQLAEDQVQNIMFTFRDKPLQFVRGDFAQEEILSRANLTKARAVIIIPDASAGLTVRSDEKTILTAFSVKAIHPKVELYAHILDRDNEPYLKKAQVNDYIVSDAFSGILLGEMVTSPGVSQSIRQMIHGGDTRNLIREPLPAELSGKTFGDAIYYYRQRNQLPIGVVKEQKSLSLSHILTEDYSDLDKFIAQKFEKAGKSLKKGDYLDVRINPADNIVLEKDVSLILIK